MNTNEEEDMVKELKHLDRVAFGTNSIYLFHQPGSANILQGMIQDSIIDHDMASAEIWNAQEALQKVKYAKEREEQEAA